MKSTTLQSAYDLAKFCVLCLLGFVVLVVLDVEGSDLGEYVMLVSACLGGLTTVLGVAGARHLPTANRAPTSAELTRDHAVVASKAPAPTVLATDP